MTRLPGASTMQSKQLDRFNALGIDLGPRTDPRKCWAFINHCPTTKATLYNLAQRGEPLDLDDLQDIRDGHYNTVYRQRWLAAFVTQWVQDQK